MTGKTHVQWYLGRQSETGIQQQPGLVPVGHADPPALRDGEKRLGARGCCMPVWNGQTLTFVQDRPSDVVWPYTNSDVVVDDNGVGFRYSFSA
ncbi:hypothetical protein [Escherichia coli]|uniref:hypothetical protein n=1 Tax=Escherichia coli TaxID=562 RepID=UPI003CC90F6C